jgi:hypothetical protein
VVLLCNWQKCNVNIPDQLSTGHVYDVPYFGYEKTLTTETRGKPYTAPGEAVKMYVRESTHLQWEFLCRGGPLCESDQDNLWQSVRGEGPPGCGKSTELRALCWYSASVKKLNVLHILQNSGLIYWTLLRPCADGGCEICLCEICFGMLGDYKHFEALEELISMVGSVSLVALDGLRNDDNSKEWVRAVETTSRTKQDDTYSIIYMSSIQMDFKWDKWELLEPKKIQPAFLSWSLEDYKEACNDDGLWKSVLQFIPVLENQDQIMAIENKFTYAGGCARWMFSAPVHKICELIVDAAQKVQSFDDLICGNFGHKSATALNSLRNISSESPALPHGQFQLVSQYAYQAIARCASKQVASQLWRWAETLDNNAPMKGWAFEARCINDWINGAGGIDVTLQYLDTVTAEEYGRSDMSKHTAKKLSPGPELQLNIPKISSASRYDLSLDNKILTSAKPANELYGTNIIILPTSCLHPCFDIVFISNKNIFCVQCTMQEKHSRKMDAIKHLVEEVEKFIKPVNIHLVACVYGPSFSSFEFEWPIFANLGGRDVTCWKFSKV